MRRVALAWVALLAVSGIVAGCTAAATMTDASPSATTAPSPSVVGPPDGFLTVGGSEPLAGLRGSSCWTGPGPMLCDDTPWLVPESVSSIAAAHEPCSVALASGVAIIEWSIVAAPAGAGDPFGSATHLSSRGIGRPVAEVPFVCPTEGDWVVHAFVRAQAGDVSYYWRVQVDGPAGTTS